MSNIQINGKTHKFMLNGTEYFGGKSLNDGGDLGIELLCEGSAIGNDTEEKVDYSSLTEGANFSEYLSYNHTSKEFTVVKACTVFIIPWTYNYDTASGSYSHGEFYINGTKEANWVVDYRGEGYYAGKPIVKDLSVGDTMYGYTPSSDGYPQQKVKIYRIDSTLKSLFINMMKFNNENGGIGKVIT